MSLGLKRRGDNVSPCPAAVLIFWRKRTLKKLKKKKQKEKEEKDHFTMHICPSYMQTKHAHMHIMDRYTDA